MTVQIPLAAPGAKYVHVTCRMGEPRPGSSPPGPRRQPGEVTLRIATGKVRYQDVDGARILTVQEWKYSIRAADGELFDPRTGEVGVEVLSGLSGGVDPPGFPWKATVTPASGDRWESTVPAMEGVFDLADGVDIPDSSVGTPTLTARVAVLEAAVADRPAGGGGLVEVAPGVFEVHSTPAGWTPVRPGIWEV